MKNKTEAVLSHLQKKKKITSWDAIELYGATRLAAIIHNLKEYGYEIHTQMAYDDKGTRWAVYHYRGYKYA
jgi:N-acetyl-anhydromuramyl-L-alanine amidase AmpD